MNTLVRYDAMRSAIAAAHGIDEIKDIRDKACALQLYARQANDTQLERQVHDIRVRAERRAGELLRELPKATPGGSNQHKDVSSQPTRPRTLPELGISRDQSAQWQKLAAVPEDEFEEQLANPVALPTAAGIIAWHNHRTSYSGDCEWFTPAAYVDAARNAMGGIDLDPASSEIANKTVNAALFHSIEDDGLTKEWRGRVWMNPPYSQPAIVDFITKLVDEVDAGNVTEAIALTHNNSDTAWFHLAANAATALCFTRGRIAFENSRGSKAAPPQGQTFFYYGDHVGRFTQVFNEIGLVVARVGGLRAVEARPPSFSSISIIGERS